MRRESNMVLQSLHPYELGEGPRHKVLIYVTNNHGALTVVGSHYFVQVACEVCDRGAFFPLWPLHGREY